MRDKLIPYLLTVVRIVAALLILQHGTVKLFGFPHGQPYTGFPNFSLLGIAGMLEVGGGTLLLLGLFTRPVAFILSGEMAVAYFTAHLPNGFFPILNGGELTVLLCFFFLFLSAAGGGLWSIDHLLRAPPKKRVPSG